jgi:hypothetical protein
MFRRMPKILCGNLWSRSQGIDNVLVYFVGMGMSDIYLCMCYKLQWICHGGSLSNRYVVPSEWPWYEHLLRTQG